MKRSMWILTALAVTCFFSALPISAQRGGHGGGGGASGGHGAASGTHGNPDTGGGGKSAAASKQELTKVVNNPDSKLAKKLTSLLPSGMTLAQASAGFTNLGRFVAALHVYHNLDIASSSKCTGETAAQCWSGFAGAAQAKSLGSAIKQYDPTANASAETKKGTKQANDDLKESAETS